MLLRNFYLQLDIPACDKQTVDDVYEFKKKSKHITNYINRECFGKYKFTSNAFNSFGINFRHEVVRPYVFNKSLITILPFNQKAYDRCKDNKSEFRSYIETSIKEALNKVDEKHDIPASTILNCLNELKANNYENRWLHQRKTDRARKIVAELHGTITMEQFSLRLFITQNNEVKYNNIVLVTDPDEVAFYYRFKDIIINRDSIIVTAKVPANLLEYSLNTHEIKIHNNK